MKKIGLVVALSLIATSPAWAPPKKNEEKKDESKMSTPSSSSRPWRDPRTQGDKPPLPQKQRANPLDPNTVVGRPRSGADDMPIGRERSGGITTNNNNNNTNPANNNNANNNNAAPAVPAKPAGNIRTDGRPLTPPPPAKPAQARSLTPERAGPGSNNNTGNINSPPAPEIERN